MRKALYYYFATTVVLNVLFDVLLCFHFWRTGIWVGFET